MQTLAERLAWARDKSGLTQRSLARAAGLKSEQHIRQLETGERANPELKTLKAIATALGVTIGWLANGEEPAPSGRRIRQSALAALAESEKRGAA